MPTATPNHLGSDPPRRLLVVLGMLTATVPMALDMYLPSLPAVAADLGASEGAVAHSVSAFLLGLALGQFLLGPLSDKYGRRAILTLSLVLFTGAGLACALATSIGQLIFFRILQALGCGAVAVVVNALVRDLFEERASASIMSFVFMVMLLAPLVAPLIGGYLLAAFDWRFIFWVLAAYGALCLPAQRRWVPRVARSAASRALTGRQLLLGYARVLRHPGAMGYNLVSGCASAVMFAFLTGSSFFYIEVHGVAPTHFGYLFAVNVLALMLCAQLNRLLLRRRRSLHELILYGVLAQSAASAALLLGVWSGVPGLAALVACIALAIGAMGLVGANSTSKILGYFPDATGTAAAVIGVSRFAFGAAAGALVGVFHDGSGLSMAAVMAGCALAALLCIVLLAGPARAPA